MANIDNGIGVMKDRWHRDVISGYDDEYLDGEKYANASKAAEWMVRIESTAGGGVITSSNNAQFQECCRSMTAPQFSVSRRTNANTVDANKYDSARVRISNLVWAIPHDIWTPQLENICINGIQVDIISFVRLTNSGQIDEVAETLNFYNNIIQHVKQERDILVVEVRTEQYDRTTIRRLQTGEVAGQNSVSYNIRNSIIQGGAGGAGGGGGEEAAAEEEAGAEVY